MKNDDDNYISYSISLGAGHILAIVIVFLMAVCFIYGIHSVVQDEHSKDCYKGGGMWTNQGCVKQ